MKKSLLIFILILVAGLIPIRIYFLENNNSLNVNIASLPSRNLTLPEQQVQAFAGLVIKPVYMMLSLIIILALIGQKRSPIIALHWGQISFLAGEIFCAINFYIYRHESILSEYLHSYGMVLGFGFTTFALLEGLNARFVRLTRIKFAAQMRQTAKFTLPVFAVLTFIPLLSPIQPQAYTVTILGFPYSYTRLDVYEIYERRVLPLLALLSFVLAFPPLIKKGKPLITFNTQFFTCTGMGALGFSFFRTILSAIFVNNLVWFEFWEEATELMFVGMVGFVLWQFRKILLQKTPILEEIPVF